MSNCHDGCKKNNFFSNQNKIGLDGNQHFVGNLAEANNGEYTFPKLTHGGAMTWTCMSARGVGGKTFIDRTMSSCGYARMHPENCLCAEVCQKRNILA